MAATFSHRMRQPTPARARGASSAWRSRSGALLRRNELQQAVLVVAAFLAYFAVRGITQGSHVTAIDHARAVVDLEKRLGFYWEPWLQRQMIDRAFLVTFANWI